MLAAIFTEKVTLAIVAAVVVIVPTAINAWVAGKQGRKLDGLKEVTDNNHTLLNSVHGRALRDYRNATQTIVRLLAEQTDPSASKEIIAAAEEEARKADAKYREHEAKQSTLDARQERERRDSA